MGERRTEEPASTEHEPFCCDIDGLARSVVVYIDRQNGELSPRLPLAPDLTLRLAADLVAAGTHESASERLGAISADGLPWEVSAARGRAMLVLHDPAGRSSARPAALALTPMEALRFGRMVATAAIDLLGRARRS